MLGFGKLSSENSNNLPFINIKDKEMTEQRPIQRKVVSQD